jgi:hypothetical protein
MTIIRRTYLDLSPKHRKEGAKIARARLKSALANPLLTTDQRIQLQEQMHKLAQWEAGTLQIDTGAKEES